MRRMVLIVLWMALAAGARVYGSAAASLVWENFSYANSAEALALWQDTAWVGTSGGLVQWDLPSGTPRIHLAPDGFADNAITAVVVDAEGRPWIGMGSWNGGLAVLHDGEWTHWDGADGLASDWVTCLAVDDHGRKWIGTVRGLTVLDDGGTPSDKTDDRRQSFRVADGLVDQMVNAVCFDSEDRVWIATSSGVGVLDTRETPLDKADDVWTTFTAADGLLANASHGVATDEAGRIWIGTRGGVSVLDFGGTPADPKDDIWAHIGAEHGLSSGADFYGVVFRDGTAWIPGSNGLVAIEGGSTPFDPSDDRVTTYRTADGLLANHVPAVAFDNAGVAWCAVLQGGLNRFDAAGTPSDKSDDSWASYVVESRLPGSDVRAVRAEDGRVWVGSSRLAVFGDGKTAQFDIRFPLALARSDAGILWVATTGGLVALDEGGTPWDPADDVITSFSSADGLPASYVRAVSVDALGRVWAATSNGIGVLDPAGTPHDKSDDRWATFATSDGLAGDIANAIAVDGGRRVWVVHESHSVSCLDHAGTPFDKSDDAWVLFGEGSPIGTASGYSVVVDGAGVKWFGLCPGLFAFDDGGTLADRSDDRWQVFDVGDCDPGIALDEAGRMWVATGWSGVIVVDYGGTPFDPSDDVTVEYSVEDGLIDDRTQAIATHEGVVWVGTDGGLSRCVP